MKRAEQLPDCMMPDGVAPCVGYQELRKKWLADQVLFSCLKEDWDKANAIITLAKEMRLYCLGSDASTRDLIERFDALIAASKEKGEP